MSLKLTKIAVLAALCSVSAGTLCAQPLVRGRIIGGSATADPQQGVYVRDSAIAADKFELGKRMERLKEWHKSADVYQEILEKYQDRVVPTATNEKGQTIQYASVTVAVQERLAKWPEEGLTVYRNRFEPVAAIRLEQARPNNLQDLHEIFAAYFVTETARTAGIRLMDLYTEAGEFSAAAWIGERLLEWHPTLGAERSTVLFRTAVAYHLAGNANQANRRADELKAKHGDELATVAGKELPLADAIAAQLQQSAPVASGAGGSSWRTFGGDESRNLLVSADGRPGARIYSIDLPGPITTGLNEQLRDNIMRPYENARNLGQTINVFPVVDRGELFFQDGWRVYALHLESGVPLSGWAQTYASRNGQYWINPPNNINFELVNASAAMLPQQHTLTLTDDAVLAVMGQRDPRMNAAIAAQAILNGGTQLVCLDRATGQVRWSVAPRVNEQDQANVRNLEFSGSPLVVGENVYVIARGSSGAGVEECHVYCYALEGGEYKWSSYVASSQSGFFQMGGMPGAMLDNDTLSHLAFASGRIFVLTNLGAVAAIDAYSGATAWLTIYPRQEHDNNNARQRIIAGGGWGAVPARSSGTSIRPWEFNPTIVSDGKVFVLPTDSRYVLVYDAGSGTELKRINREIIFNTESSDPPVYQISMLLGVVGEKLFLGTSPHGSGHGVLCIDWPKAEPRKRDARALVDDALLYMMPAKLIEGRPFLSATQLVTPNENVIGIAQLNIEKIGFSKIIQNYPEGGADWPDGEGPGNVIVTPDHVIVANERNVSVYTDLQSVHEKLDMALRADPGNIEARLVFSEIMFNARAFEEASKRLDEAIDLLGGIQSMRPGALRDRIFSDAILFAQRIGANKEPESIVRADGLYNRAAYAANNVSQQVHYRLSRARFIESLKDVQPRPDYTTAVRLYQEILSDGEMRAITLAGEQSGPTQAGKVAEGAITELIRKVGRSIYQPFDQQAAAALEALADTKNANQLLALSEQYPHATAATQALMQAAQVYEQQDQPRMATLVLRRLYWKYYDRSSNPERAKLAEAMARNYLKVGNYGAALGRLQRIAKLLPNAPLTNPPLLTPDGKPLASGEKPARTISEAAEALERFVRQLAPNTLPDVKLPPPLTFEERLARKRSAPPFEDRDAQADTVAGVQSILAPPIELSDHVRQGRTLIWSDNHLVRLDGATTEPTWTSNALADGPAAGIAWIEDDVLVWGEGEAAVLNGETGNAAWRVELKSIPTAELLVPDAPGNDAPAAPIAAARRPNGAPNPDPRAALIEAQQRALLQRQQELEAVLRQRALIQQQVAIRGGRVAVPQPALQPAVQQPPHDGKERVLHVRPLIDRVILSTTTGRVLALDIRDGNVIWQTRLSNNPRAIQQTLANDDFTVIRMTDAPVVQLVVLDSFSGQLILRKRFSASQPGWPINCALSPDGTLAWTTNTSMAAKDLYEPGDAPSWERPNGNYANMIQPDQLLIWNQQVLAVCNNGRFVARRSLRSGDDVPDMHTLNTGNDDATTRLRLTGPRLYVISDKAMIAYHLEQETSCNATVYPYTTILPSGSMLTKDYVVLPALRKPEPDEPAQDPAQLDRYLLMAYSRALIPNSETGKLAESGLQVHRYDFREPSRIKSFHPTEGGIFYLAGDERLHLLKGSRE